MHERNSKKKRKQTKTQTKKEHKDKRSQIRKKQPVENTKPVKVRQGWSKHVQPWRVLISAASLHPLQRTLSAPCCEDGDLRRRRAELTKVQMKVRLIEIPVIAEACLPVLLKGKTYEKVVGAQPPGITSTRFFLDIICTGLNASSQCKTMPIQHVLHVH